MHCIGPDGQHITCLLVMALMGLFGQGFDEMTVVFINWYYSGRVIYFNEIVNNELLNLCLLSG